MNKHYKFLKRIASSLAIFWMLFSNITAVKALDCNSLIKDSENSTIDVVTESHSNEIKKGESFKVFVKNFNDYAINYTVILWDQKKTLKFSEDKALDVYRSANNSSVVSIDTNKYSTGDYQVETRVYNTSRDCLLKTETKDIKITKDSTAASNIQWFDKGNVRIGFPYKSMEANTMFPIIIENVAQYDLDYVIKTDNLQTGEFVTKQGGTITGDMTQTIMINITTPGKHTVQVIFYYTGQTQPLTFYGQSYEVNVTEKSTAKTTQNNDPGKTEKEDPPDPNAVVTTAKITAASNPITNSDGDGIGPTLGKIFKAIFTNGEAANADLSSVNKLIVEITNYALNFAGITAFVMVLWAGRMYFNSYGSDEAATMGKKTLTWAVVGLLVILISKGLLNWMVTFFRMG